MPLSVNCLIFTLNEPLLFQSKRDQSGQERQGKKICNFSIVSSLECWYGTPKAIWSVHKVKGIQGDCLVRQGSGSEFLCWIHLGLLPLPDGHLLCQLSARTDRLLMKKGIYIRLESLVRWITMTVVYIFKCIYLGPKKDLNAYHNPAI